MKIHVFNWNTQKRTCAFSGLVEEEAKSNCPRIKKKIEELSNILFCIKENKLKDKLVGLS